MTNSVNRSLLSIGVFLIIVVVSVMLASLNVFAWGLVPPVMIALCGCWLLVLAGMQSASPEKYGRSAMSLLGGVCCPLRWVERCSWQASV